MHQYHWDQNKKIFEDEKKEENWIFEELLFSA